MQIRMWLGLCLLCGSELLWAAGLFAPAWRPWHEGQFDQARREGKLVLLDLEAVWCHWCHVMDQRTYADPLVQRLLARHYLAVKVDHDARPDLAQRYREYGWPATIVFDAQGRELVKRSGYIAPDDMARLLQAVVADPTPEEPAAQPPRFADSPLLPAALRDELQRRVLATHDAERGGLKLEQKFLDRDTAEYLLQRAGRGDAAAAVMVRRDLDAARQLLDPVWGGVYQYSTGADWRTPHFEKLLRSQAEYLRLYAIAYAETGDAAYAQTANDILRYVRAFLQQPDGAFAMSQDADVVPGRHAAEYFAGDDAARRAIGLPKVDRNTYTQENGWMIHALTLVYSATGAVDALQDARRAAAWALRERRLPGGGFRHAAHDPAGPYLGANLAMARALLGLYAVTADPVWLQHAVATADFMQRRFRAAAGYRSAVSRGRVPPVWDIDENIALARFANLLAHYTGQPRHRAMAEHAMRYLVSPAVATSRITEAGILLAAEELANAPAHLTIVGSKRDAAAQHLFAAALPIALAYRRLEWWDRRQGRLPNHDVVYPELPRAAAFYCADKRCSLPAFTANEVAEFRGLGRE